MYGTHVQETYSQESETETFELQDRDVQDKTTPLVKENLDLQKEIIVLFHVLSYTFC